MSFCEKRNNLDELNNIPTKGKEKSMVQISFMTQDQTSRQAQSGIRAKIYSPIHDPQCFPNPRIRLIYSKNPQYAHFLRPNTSIR